MIPLDCVIEGCKKGDASMQRELYKMYSPRYYALCRRYSTNDEMAQNMLTEGFLTVFRKIKTYRGEGSIEGWMQTIFIRSIMREYRRINRNKLDYSAIEENNSPSVVYEFEQQIDIKDALVDGIRSLTPQQQYIFNIIAVEGYSFDDAASMMKTNTSTLKTHYYSARDKIQLYITQKLGMEYIKNIINT